MQTFEDLGLPKDLTKALTENGIIHPTEIQDKTISKLLKTDSDFIGLAQTGTGKTAAFGIPLIEYIDLNVSYIQSIILAPTRELAQQIKKDLVSYTAYRKKIFIEVVYGGAPISKQIQAIRNQKPQILVATPGRLIDLIERKVVNLSKVQHVVLDEADEMLNMGFQEPIDHILSFTPKEKRTWLFSATMPAEIRRIIHKYMHSPAEAAVNREQQTNENIEHKYIFVQRKDKRRALRRVIDFHTEFYGIVFCRTKIETQEVATELAAEGYSAESLHGDLSQGQRDNVMRKFRKGTLRILVATDVAARGIDVNNLTHIIHFALPDDKDYYLHRSGRTARAGKKGVSIIILSPGDQRKLNILKSHLKIEINKIILPTHVDVIGNKLNSWAGKIIEIKEKIIPENLLTICYELFANLSKEQLIKKLLSVEFSKLQQDNDQDDLNLTEDDSRGRSKTNFSDRRKERGRERGRTRYSDSRKENGNSRFSNDRKQKRNPDKNGRMHRFFINIGFIDNFDKDKLLRFVCEKTNLSKENFGTIDIMDKHSFFEVSSDKSSNMNSSFKEARLNKRILRVNRER